MMHPARAMPLHRNGDTPVTGTLKVFWQPH